MRNWIIGAAAFLAVAAPSVAAAATGYAGVLYGEADAGGAEAEFYGAEGAIAFSGSDSIVFEVDASVTDSDDTNSAFGLTGHIYSRNDRHLFGGFVGVADSDDSTTWFGGLEANKYFDRWTIGGAVFYGNNDDANVDGAGVNVDAEVFVQDNLSLNAHAGYASVDAGAGDDDVTFFGVGGEWQLASWPISFVAGYNTADFDGGDVDTWTVGARWNFGGLTLIDRNRRGASQARITGVGLVF
ncbi:MAG: hypothetical protein ACT4OF_15475 [Caulobacteraceae bacterium]